MPAPISVLVLGGGPDAERAVSIKSSTAIANAINAGGAAGAGAAGAAAGTGEFTARLEIIDRLDAAGLKALPGEVIFPYLHGPWGEGGPLQDLLERDGRPFVGSNARASRWAMDKLATKAAALELGIPTAPFWVLNPRDPVCPTRLPVVIKPVHEGSTIGLHVCTSHAEFAAAVESIRAEQAEAIASGAPVRTYMIEPKIGGERRARELTVGLIDGEPLPIIEIRPKDGLYDYEAKYNRDDTEYLVGERIQNLPEAVAKKISKSTARLAKAMGIRHIARADFMLDPDGVAWFLEINTTPGFTDHSLVPKAAAHAGRAMPALCTDLVRMALRDAKSPAQPAPAH
jgi:D-alanine-D-alanine ligase